MKAWQAVFCGVVLGVIAPIAAADHRALLAKIDSDDFGLPEPASLGEPLRLWATWYNVPSVEAIPDGFRLLDVRGRPISPPITGRDWCSAALQGTVMIREPDGTPRTYTYETTARTAEVHCRSYYKRPASWTLAAGLSRFGISIGPYGDGAGGYQLVPFRSVAVNTHLVRLGTVLYIPAARGVPITLPSGRTVTHDGYFFASDRGGDINQNHVDVFVGPSNRNPFPSFVASAPQGTFDAYVVEDGRVKARLQGLHARD